MSSNDAALTAYVMSTLAARQVYGRRYETDAQWLDRLREYVSQHHPTEYAAALVDIARADSTARALIS